MLGYDIETDDKKLNPNGGMYGSYITTDDVKLKQIM